MLAKWLGRGREGISTGCRGGGIEGALGSSHRRSERVSLRADMHALCEEGGDVKIAEESKVERGHAHPAERGLSWASASQDGLISGGHACHNGRLSNRTARSARKKHSQLRSTARPVPSVRRPIAATADLLAGDSQVHPANPYSSTGGKTAVRPTCSATTLA